MPETPLASWKSIIIVLLHIVSVPCCDAVFEGRAPPPQRIAVIGGGLAGLATAVHLLEGAAPLEALDIFDPCPPGVSR